MPEESTPETFPAALSDRNSLYKKRDSSSFMNSEYLSLSLPRAQPSILCLVSPSFSRTDAGQAVAEHRSRIKGIFPCLFPEASVSLFMAGTRGLCNCEQVDRVKHKCSLQKNMVRGQNIIRRVGHVCLAPVLQT